jgi:hypothetical protein
VLVMLKMIWLLLRTMLQIRRAKKSVAEPPELFRFKCADHRYTGDRISSTSNETTHWSVGSPPDSTTVTQDRRRFTSHEGESSLIAALKFYTTG